MSQDVIKAAYEKGYRANDDGTITGIYTDKLVLHKGTNGYLIFVIREGKKTRTVPVHRFAAYCFFGESLFESQCVRHINGDKTDNRKDNLTLGSLSDNYHDISENWRREFSMKGAKVTRKLSNDDVLEIKSLLAKGESYRTISSKYGVAKSTIQQIKEGKSYKWVI